MKRALFLLSAVSGLALSASPTWAQEDPGAPQEDASQPTFNDTIVVTARRRAEDISNVPVSISAFSGDQLEQKSITNIADLVKITPGVNLAGAGSRNNAFITIRGQSRGVTGNIQAGVTTYLNEVPLPTLGSLIPTFDLENIQVLKGPQGTAFGRNSMGGAVLVYSKAPSYDFGGYAIAEVASFDYKKFEGAINIPIVNDMIALRLSTQQYFDGGNNHTTLVSEYTVDASGIAHPGQIMPLKHNLDETRANLIRASLLIEPNDSISNVTVFDYQHLRGTNNSQFNSFYPGGFVDSNGIRSNPAIYLLPESVIRGPAVAGRFGANFAQSLINLTQCGYSVTCDYRLAQAYGESTRNSQLINQDPWDSYTELWGISNTTNVQLSDDMALKNIFGYRNVSIYNNGDNEGSPLYVVATATYTNLEQFTDELQLSGNMLDNKLTYTLGGFYYIERPSGPGGNQALEVNALQGLSHSIVTTFLTNESKAVYGLLDYSFDDLIDGLSFTAGIRQTWDKIKDACASNVAYTFTAEAMYLNDGENEDLVQTQSECQNNTLTTADYPGSRSVVSQNFPDAKFNQFTYSFGLNYQVTPDVLLYAVTRRGYRAGNYNTPLFDPYVGDVQTFAPETLEDWEVGTKIRWSSGGMRGSLDIAAFTGKDKNNQFILGTAGMAGGVCVPEAIGSDGRAANCTTAPNAPNPNVPGVTVAHAPASTAVNGGSLTIRGFEAAGTLSPLEGLTFGAGVSYVDYKVDSVSLPESILNLLTAANIQIPTTITLAQQPKWTYNFDVDVELPDDVIGTAVRWNVNFKHSDSFFLGTSTVKAYDLVDTRLSFPSLLGGPVDLAFYIKNLMNEDYDAGTSASQPGSLGVDSFIHGTPRTFGMSVRYNFGAR